MTMAAFIIALLDLNRNLDKVNATAITKNVEIKQLTIAIKKVFTSI
jgi:hypothetical protein